MAFPTLPPGDPYAPAAREMWAATGFRYVTRVRPDGHIERIYQKVSHDEANP